jgi:hypothetical protein
LPSISLIQDDQTRLKACLAWKMVSIYYNARTRALLSEMLISTNPYRCKHSMEATAHVSCMTIDMLASLIKDDGKEAASDPAGWCSVPVTAVTYALPLYFGIAVPTDVRSPKRFGRAAWMLALWVSASRLICWTVTPSKRTAPCAFQERH